MFVRPFATFTLLLIVVVCLASFVVVHLPLLRIIGQYYDHCCHLPSLSTSLSLPWPLPYFSANNLYTFQTPKIEERGKDK